MTRTRASAKAAGSLTLGDLVALLNGNRCHLERTTP